MSSRTSSGRWSSRMCHWRPQSDRTSGASDRRTLQGSTAVSGLSAPGASSRCDLPERFGPWQTVYDHFRNWRKSGVFAAIVEVLQVKLDNKGYIDWELWCVDGSSVRAARAAAGADKKVLSDIPTNPSITSWAAAEAGLDRSSTWSLTVRALHSPSKSPPGKSTSRRVPNRSSGRRSRP